MVNIAGKRCSLEFLNQQIRQIEGVDDGVFIFASENTKSMKIQRTVALYVSSTLTKQEVLEKLRKKIDSAFIPRPLYKVNKIPRNATGKITSATIVDLIKTSDDIKVAGI